MHPAQRPTVAALLCGLAPVHHKSCMNASNQAAPTLLVTRWCPASFAHQCYRLRVQLDDCAAQAAGPDAVQPAIACSNSDPVPSIQAPSAGHEGRHSWQGDGAADRRAALPKQQHAAVLCSHHQLPHTIRLQVAGQVQEESSRSLQVCGRICNTATCGVHDAMPLASL